MSRLVLWSSIFFLLLSSCGREYESPVAPSVSAARQRSVAASIHLNPRCLAPAPLEHNCPCGPGYIVVYRNGVDAVTTTARLSSKYGFRPKYVWTSAILGFSAEMSEANLAAIRCEPEVKYTSTNALGQLATR